MKTLLITLTALFMTTFAQAETPNSVETPNSFVSGSNAEFNCGSNDVVSSRAYASADPDFETFFTINNSLRSITIRSTKRKTVIREVYAYDQRTGKWLDFTRRFRRKANCTAPGELCSNQEATICIGKRRRISGIEVSTSGSGRGRYRVKLGYRRL